MSVPKWLNLASTNFTGSLRVPTAISLSTDTYHLFSYFKAWLIREVGQSGGQTVDGFVRLPTLKS